MRWSYGNCLLLAIFNLSVSTRLIVDGSYFFGEAMFSLLGGVRTVLICFLAFFRLELLNIRILYRSIASYTADGLLDLYASSSLLAGFCPVNDLFTTALGIVLRNFSPTSLNSSEAVLPAYD